MLVKFPEPQIAPELAALAVNLTLYKKNCEVIVSKGFEPLITRAFKNGDMLLMKSMKNIVSKMRHKDVQQVINQHLEGLIKAAFHRETPNVMRLELLGIIAYTDCKDWAPINKETQIVQYLQQYLQIGFCEDDIQLECIMILQNVAKDQGMSAILAKSMVIKQIIVLLNEKQEDDEIVNQLLFAIYCLILHEHTRNVILTQTQIVE